MKIYNSFAFPLRAFFLKGNSGTAGKKHLTPAQVLKLFLQIFFLFVCLLLHFELRLSTFSQKIYETVNGFPFLDFKTCIFLNNFFVLKLLIFVFV